MQNSVRTLLRFSIKQCRAETGEDWENLKYLWKASSVLVFKYFAISLFLKKIEEKNEFSYLYDKDTSDVKERCYG